MRRTFLLSLIALPGVLASLGGCTQEPRPLFRLGTNVWVGYEPLNLARALGHYDAQRIRLVEHPSATSVLRSLLAGELEAAALTLDEVLTLQSQGMDLKVVLIFDYSAGADAVVARPEVGGLAGLKGKRVGVEAGAVGAVMLSALLETADLDLDDITRVPISAHEQVSSYQSGQVDVVIGFEPNISRLRSLGAQVLMDSRAIPNRIIDVLAVRSEVLPLQAPVLEEVLNGYLAALFHQQARPNDAYSRMSGRLGADVAQQLAGIHQPDLAENIRLLDTLDQQAQGLADTMLLNQLLPHALEVKGLGDSRYLPKS